MLLLQSIKHPYDSTYDTNNGSNNSVDESGPPSSATSGSSSSTSSSSSAGSTTSSSSSSSSSTTTTTNQQQSQPQQPQQHQHQPQHVGSQQQTQQSTLTSSQPGPSTPGCSSNHSSESPGDSYLTIAEELTGIHQIRKDCVIYTYYKDCSRAIQDHFDRSLALFDGKSTVKGKYNPLSFLAFFSFQTFHLLLSFNLL